jgi:hypothetical protein
MSIALVDEAGDQGNNLLKLPASSPIKRFPPFLCGVDRAIMKYGRLHHRQLSSWWARYGKERIKGVCCTGFMMMR